MKHLLQELQTTLTHEIPITQHLGITVDSYQHECLILKAPLERNINHRGTAFAGSLNALATLAGWGHLWLVLKELGVPAKIVVQDSTSNYLLPVKNDFSASCRRPTPPQIALMERTLHKRGKARVELRVEICDDNEVAVSFKARYVVILVNE